MSGTQIRRECFYQILPSKTLGDMEKECRGGKMAKERDSQSHFLLMLVVAKSHQS